jgi:Uma2 family endonuclease
MDTFVLKGEVAAGLSDAEFFRFCLDNPDLRIERNNKLEITIMSPTGSLSGRVNAEINRQLSNWNYEQGNGEVFDSSTGFTLPDRSVLSPDAAWLSNEKWNTLSNEEQDRFAPVCPEFVIEVRSKSDSLEMLKTKMKNWLANGTQLAWLIDPIDGISYVYKNNHADQVITGMDKKITGEAPVTGFVLDLALLKL